MNRDKASEKDLDQSSDSTTTQYDPSHRGQNRIQGEEVATTGGTRDRQPRQSIVPDAELNGD